MAGKKKFTPRKLKTPKRMPPRKSSDSGVNPLLVAGGAALGAKAGGNVSNKRRQTRAQRTVGTAFAGDTSRAKGAGDAWGPVSDERARMRGAMDTYAAQKMLTPKIDRNKFYTRKQALEGGMTLKEANKFAGVTRGEQKIIDTRRSLAADYRRAETPKAVLDVAVKQRRFGMDKVGASKRSRAAGGLTGAAISAIAQLVAKELRKKR